MHDVVGICGCGAVFRLDRRGSQAHRRAELFHPIHAAQAGLHLECREHSQSGADDGRQAHDGRGQRCVCKADRSKVRSLFTRAELVPELRLGEIRVFQGNKASWAFFEAQPAGYRKRVLHWITTAKREPTRSGRFAELLRECALGNRLSQFKYG